MSSYRDWHVGMRVVCVDDSRGVVSRTKDLVRGRVYEIADMQMNDDGLGVFLVGLRRHRTGWRASRFRPVRKRKTDISIFTAMLTKTSPWVSA